MLKDKCGAGVPLKHSHRQQCSWLPFNSKIRTCLSKKHFSRPWQLSIRRISSGISGLSLKTGLKRVLLSSWFKMAGLCSKDRYCGTLDLEEQLMERSRTGKACVLALALGWMDKKKPLAEKGERWLIMWNWEEIHYSYAISRWLAFSERHLLLVVLLAFAAHTVFWIEVLNNYFSAWLRKLVIAP